MSPELEAGHFVLFELDGGHAQEPTVAALDVRDVHRVREQVQVTRVPLAPPEIEGIFTHQGRIVTSVDPAPLLGNRVQNCGDSPILILRQSAAHPGTLGLRVSKVRGVAFLEPEEAVEVEGIAPCFLWTRRRSGDTILVMSIHGLIKALGQRFDFGEHPGKRR